VTVAIVGVGEIEPAWKDERSLLALVTDAVWRALDDAGIAAAEVDGFTSEAETLGVRPDQVGRAIRARDRRFSAQTSIAGAGVIGALQLAELAIDAGLADIVVSYYGISLSSRDGNVGQVHAEDPAKASLEMPFGFFGQAVYFAALAQRYAYEFGLSEEQLAAVPLAARAFAQRTPDALRREPLDLDGYLADRIVSDPLRRLDCCLINDAAAAFVVTSIDRARELRTKPVVVAGTGFGTKPVSEAEYFTQNP
jgi:acetyl-CoA acetyltransferase